MTFFQKLSLAIIAAIFALPFAIAQSDRCETGADTMVTYVTAGNQASMKAGAGQRALEFIAGTAKAGLSGYAYRIVNGENGDVIQSCGVTSEKSANWLTQKIAFPNQRAFMHATTSMPQTGNMTMVEALHAGARYSERGKRNILIVDASKIYHDPREPGYSFKDGHLASDGMFGEPRLLNPFSVEGLGSLLSHTEVYLIDIDDEAYATAQHQAGLMRFWYSYVALLGGELKGLQLDAGTALETALNGHNTVREAFAKPDLSAKPDMLVLRPVKLNKIDLSTEIEIRAMSCYTATLDGRPQRLRLALVWDGKDVDLDLYTRVRGPELSYRNVRTDEGRFEKTQDQNYSGGLNGYEIVEFKDAVDPRRVSIWINAYRNNAPSPRPIKATLKGTYGSRCFSVPVTIPATRGDRGAGRSARQQNRNWVEIDLSKEQS